MADLRSVYHPDGTMVINCDRILSGATYINHESDCCKEGGSCYCDEWIRLRLVGPGDGGDPVDIVTAPYNDHNMYVLDGKG